jgi:23S rRNA (uracil1939-C5)-methyltransferase
LPLAKNFKTVTGVENHPESIRNAAANAALNHIQYARFTVADAGKFLAEQNPGYYGVIVLDPPRSGCEPLVLESLLRLRPRKIVYISCSPESLARDLSVLTKNLYSVKLIQPVDMFPHTYHIETMVELEYSVHQEEPLRKQPGHSARTLHEPQKKEFKKKKPPNRHSR